MTEWDYDRYNLGKDVQKLFIQLEKIMSALDDLKAEVATLKQVVADDQTADAATVAALQAQIDTLTGELANGASASQIAEVTAALQDIQAGVTPA
jgi:hypothetical protein